jgi:hypothetical protein
MLNLVHVSSVQELIGADHLEIKSAFASVSSVAGKTLGLCDPPSILSRLLPLLAVSRRSGILLSRQRRECGQDCRSESIFSLPRSRCDLSYLSLSVTAHRMLKDHSNRGKEGRTFVSGFQSFAAGDYDIEDFSER